eukprot:7748116-Pyramimonas_sp.AAC.1
MATRKTSGSNYTFGNDSLIFGAAEAHHLGAPPRHAMSFDGLISNTMLCHATTSSSALRKEIYAVVRDGRDGSDVRYDSSAPSLPSPPHPPLPLSCFCSPPHVRVSAPVTRVSCASWHDREPHPRPQWQRSHAAVQPISAHPSPAFVAS